jgi:hypothetical protein
MDEGNFESDRYRVIYSGGKAGQRGVAIMLDRDTPKRVVEIKRSEDIMMMVKLYREMAKMSIIQIYMHVLTTGHEDEEVDKVGPI